jgi:hypothetical protein
VPFLLTAHRARFSLLDGAGRAVGAEDLTVATGGDEVQVRSRIEAEGPFPAEVLLEWRLDAELNPRVLNISSRNQWGAVHELEAAVTGNGMLAHRSGPDGPSQVELGWGLEAAFNHLSAAFSEVILARAARVGAPLTTISAVTVTSDELELVVVSQRYRLLGTGADGGREYSCLTIDSGREDRLRVSAEGVLLEYSGLLQLERMELAPTK